MWQDVKADSPAPEPTLLNQPIQYNLKKVTPFTTKRILEMVLFSKMLFARIWLSKVNPPMLFIKPKENKYPYNHNVQIEGQNVR